MECWLSLLLHNWVFRFNYANDEQTIWHICSWKKPVSDNFFKQNQGHKKSKCFYWGFLTLITQKTDALIIKAHIKITIKGLTNWEWLLPARAVLRSVSSSSEDLLPDTTTQQARKPMPSPRLLGSLPARPGRVLLNKYYYYYYYHRPRKIFNQLTWSSFMLSRQAGQNTLTALSKWANGGLQNCWFQR